MCVFLFSVVCWPVVLLNADHPSEVSYSVSSKEFSKAG